LRILVETTYTSPPQVGGLVDFRKRHELRDCEATSEIPNEPDSEKGAIVRTVLAFMATLVVVGCTQTSHAASPSAVVSLPLCVRQSGGDINVPQNTPISLRLGWFTSPLGAVQAFLQAKVLDVSVNGVPVQNIDSYWSPILQVDQDVWGVVWLYPTGISLQGGATMTVTFSLYISHNLTEVDPDTGERTFFGPAYVFGPTETCTIR